MINQKELKEKIKKGEFNSRLYEVYGKKSDIDCIKNRMIELLDVYALQFNKDDEVSFFSGSGRTEICGNHTDHQNGCVLAAAVNLDAIACAAKNNSNKVCIKSKGYPDVCVDISDLKINDFEKETSTALVRGVAAKIIEMGYKLNGFNAVVNSTVLGGSGLSSSAAYEVLIGVIFNDLYCENKLDEIKIAQIGQYAENNYFGKPCGLMDQLASSVGGIVAIDFKDSQKPKVKKIDYDFEKSGYSMCIIDSGANHADLTDEYAAIPSDMKAVAKYFDKELLGQIDEEKFWCELANVRKQAGDRAVVRAIHFFTDNKNVECQTSALEKNDFETFLSYVNKSGNSSAECLQNIYCSNDTQNQAVNITIQVAKKVLNGKGAVRVHGGGFAGTVQAYVPKGMEDEFKKRVEMIIGQNSCHFLSVRPKGGVKLI